MLAKNLRLDPKDIPFVARKGKKYDNEFFFVRAWFDDSLDCAKFAISVSVKIDKRAVVRNRIKRKFRAVLTEIATQNPNLRKAKYLIVIKQRSLIDKDNNDIEILLKEIIK